MGLPNIPKLSKEYEGHPTAMYGIAATDFLVKDMEKEIGGKCKQLRCRGLEEINQAFQYTINLFKKEKHKYTNKQIQLFLERKIHTGEKIFKIQKKHITMIFTEMTKNNKDTSPQQQIESFELQHMN